MEMTLADLRDRLDEIIEKEGKDMEVIFTIDDHPATLVVSSSAFTVPGEEGDEVYNAVQFDLSLGEFH